MKYYIFISNEGYTYMPNSESIDPDIENCQVIGFASGINAEDAFINMLRENPHLIETSFDAIISYGLSGEKEKYFSLFNYKRKLNKQ